MGMAQRTCGGIPERKIRPIVTDFENAQYRNAMKQIVQLEPKFAKSAYIPWQHYSDKPDRETNWRKIVERRSLLPRLIHLSIQCASLLEEYGKATDSPSDSKLVSQTAAQSEVFALISRFSESLDLSFDVASSMIAEISSGERSAEDIPVHIMSLMTFGVFMALWRLSSHYADALQMVKHIGDYFHRFFIMFGECWPLQKVPRYLPEREFAIYLKSLSGKTRIIMLAGSYSVFTLKCLVCKKTQIVPEDQWISFACKPLRDKYALSFYSVTDGSTVNLNSRLLGGRRPRARDICFTCGMTYSSRANLQAHELYHPVADADALNYAAAAAAAREVFLEEILTRLVYWLGNLLILDFSVFHQQALNDFSELTKEERDTISNKCILRVRRDNGYSDAINAARVCDSLKFRFESRSPAEPPGIYTNAKKYYRRLRKKALERRRKFLAEIEELRNEDSKRQRETAAKAEADITSDGESDSDSDTDYFGSDSENDTDSDTDSTESDDESNADSEPDYNQSDDESNADSEIDYSESDDESYSDSETEHIENDAESRVKTRHTQSDGESDLLSEIEYSEEMADLLGIDRHMFRDCI